MSNDKTEYALLTNEGRYTIFQYGDYVIKFRTSDKLKCYTEIKEWDNGYLVVTADYSTLGPVEEYIDMVPTLRNLYFDPQEFLKPIKEVRLGYV